MMLRTRLGGREAHRTQGLTTPLAIVVLGVGVAWAYARLAHRLVSLEHAVNDLADDLAEAHVARHGVRQAVSGTGLERPATDIVREVLAREAAEAKARADAEPRGTVRPLAGQRVRINRPPQSA